jgi:hypothetical protein
MCLSHGSVSIGDRLSRTDNGFGLASVKIDYIDDFDGQWKLVNCD